MPVGLYKPITNFTKKKNYEFIIPSVVENPKKQSKVKLNHHMNIGLEFIPIKICIG